MRGSAGTQPWPAADETARRCGEGGRTITPSSLPILAFPTQAAWDGWLSERGTSSQGTWPQFAKRGAGQTTLSKAEAIEVALAYGRVDGQLEKFDDRSWLVRFTRRGPRRWLTQVSWTRAQASRLSRRSAHRVPKRSCDGPARHGTDSMSRLPQRRPEQVGS